MSTRTTAAGTLRSSDVKKLAEVLFVFFNQAWWETGSNLAFSFSCAHSPVQCVSLPLGQYSILLPSPWRCQPLLSLQSSPKGQKYPLLFLYIAWLVFLVEVLLRCGLEYKKKTNKHHVCTPMCNVHREAAQVAAVCIFQLKALLEWRGRWCHFSVTAAAMGVRMVPRAVAASSSISAFSLLMTHSMASRPWARSGSKMLAHPKRRWKQSYGEATDCTAFPPLLSKRL